MPLSETHYPDSYYYHSANQIKDRPYLQENIKTALTPTQIRVQNSEIEGQICNFLHRSKINYQLNGVSLCFVFSLLPAPPGAYERSRSSTLIGGGTVLGDLPPPSTSPLHPPTLPPHVPPSSSARGRGTFPGRLSPGPYRRARFARAMHGGLAL